MLGRAAAGLAALAMLAALGCGREAGDVRGPLLETIADLEAIARDEIAILDELSGRPDTRSRHEVWRQRLDEAREALDRLAALRAEIDASTEAELAGVVGRGVLDDVEEIRDALDERIQRLQAEFGTQRIAWRTGPTAVATPDARRAGPWGSGSEAVAGIRPRPLHP